MKPGPRLLSTILLLFLTAAPAAADISACNKTSAKIAIALGVEQAEKATSHGWWVLEPQACQTLVETPDPAASYFAYAEHHQVAGNWSGEETFCIDLGSFDIEGRSKCFARGYKPVGFFELDMKTSQDLRYDFVDLAADSPADAPETPEQ